MFNIIFFCDKCYFREEDSDKCLISDTSGNLFSRSYTKLAKSLGLITKGFTPHVVNMVANHNNPGDKMLNVNKVDYKIFCSICAYGLPFNKLPWQYSSIIMKEWFKFYENRFW